MIRRIITLDPHSERPVSVSLLEDRVIDSEVLGVPVQVLITDIVHLTHEGVVCVTKLRDVRLRLVDDPIEGIYNPIVNPTIRSPKSVMVLTTGLPFLQ